MARQENPALPYWVSKCFSERIGLQHPAWFHRSLSADPGIWGWEVSGVPWSSSSPAPPFSHLLMWSSPGVRRRFTLVLLEDSCTLYMIMGFKWKKIKPRCVDIMALWVIIKWWHSLAKKVLTSTPNNENKLRCSVSCLIKLNGMIGI